MRVVSVILIYYVTAYAESGPIKRQNIERRFTV